ncbi:MAG: PKD domain-containing protein, partial [bacterium]
MFYRSLRCIVLLTLLVAAIPGIQAQNAPLAVCPDTEPMITGPAVVCESALNVVKYSTPNVTGHSYSWSVQRTSPGSGGYSIESSSNPNELFVRWTDVATFTITLQEGISGNPCTPKPAILNITSQPYLAAYFYYTFDPTFGCYYNVVGFTGDVSLHNTSNPITYFWDFGNPAVVPPTSTSPNPSVTFPVIAGSLYPVTLTITDALGRTDQIIDYVYVDPDKYKPDPQFISTPVGCLYEGINFDASGSKPTHDPFAVAPIQYYLWEFDDPSDPAPVTTYPPVVTTNHVFTTPGTYHVKLTIMNQMGCSEFLILPVTIAPTVPVANFSNLKACLGTATQFYDQSDPVSGTISNWLWNFDDPKSTSQNTSTLEDPTHVFSEIRDYYPTLTVTNSLGCVNTYKTTIPVTVSGSPKAFYSYLPPKLCEGENITFTDGSNDQGYSPIDQLLWDFAGQGTSDQSQATWNFGLPADYLVRLTVTNTDGCSSVETKTITVNAKPPVSYIWTPGPNSTLQVLFDATTIPTVGSQVYWTFGDGTTGNGLHVDKTFPFPGIYDITVTARDMGSSCETTITGSVTVGGPASANFAASPPYQCQNSGITFIPADPGGVLYTDRYHYDDGTPDDLYILGDPINPPPGSPTHVFTTPGLHTVVRTVNEGRPDVDTKSVDVYVFTLPYAHFKWYSDEGYTHENQACAGEAVYFKDYSTPLETNFPADIVGWSWNFGDPTSGSNTSTLRNPSHVFTGNNQTYIVTLTITDQNGCSSSAQINVFINPVIPVNYTIPTVACVGQAITFQSTGMDPTTIASWTWSFGDGSPNTHDPITTTHAYQASAIGLRTTTLTVTDIYGCTNSTSRDINVIPSPTAGFTYSSPTCEGNIVYFTNESVPGGGAGDHITKWEWFWNDGTTPDPEVIDFPLGNPNVQHQFPVVLGTYSWPVRLRVTNTYGCTNEITINVDLLPAPVANFTTILGTYQCAGQPVQFQDLSDPNGGGGIVGWSWDFGHSPPNNTSTAQNPLHTFPGDGNYTVTLTVRTANQCNSQPIPKTITVNKLPVADFNYTTVCEGDATSFTDNSTPNATGALTYYWDFGGGATSTVQNPTYVFPDAGYHSVILRVTNANGCVHQVTKDVMVNPKAVALFHYTNPSCANSTLTFYSDTYIPATPGSTASIQSQTWAFGDGNTGTGSVVSHTYTDGLTAHLVVLTVTTTDNCVSTTSHIINHIPAPVAGFSYTGYECEKQTVSFYDNSSPASSIASHSWVFGDAGSGSNNYSTLQNPTHDFSTSGNFTVTLIVTDYNGCVSTVFTDVITILPKPVAAFSAPPACLESGIQFTDESTPAADITQWLWQYDDGQQDNIKNPIHFFSTSGTHSVILTVTTASGCFKSVTQQVEVYEKPVPSFSTSSPTCSTDSVHFTDLSATPHGSITEWKWNFGDGSPEETRTFPQSPNVVHKYGNGGTYNVTLTIKTTDNCTAVKILPVTIQFAPLANFEFTAGACKMTPLQFTDLSQPNGGGAIVAWDWNFGDPASGSNNTSNAKNPVHAFTSGGDFLVTLIVTNAAGCLDTVFPPKTVTVNPAPVAQFTAETSCVSSPTQFTDGSTTPSGTIIAWNWDFGDPSSGTQNTSTDQNPSHTYNSPGSYSVILITTNSFDCTHDTIIQVSVNPKPQAMFEYDASCVGDVTQFTDLSIAPGSSVVSWLWTFGDGGSSTLQNPTHTYTTSGTFNVKLVVTNLSDCMDSVIMSVVARPKPIADYSYVNFFCPAGQVNFQDLSQGQGSGITDHYWIFEPGYTSTLVNPQHTFSVTDTTYLVSLIVTDTYGCKDTIIDTVYVKPGFNFTFDNNVVCHGYPTQFHAINPNHSAGDSLYSVVWNFGDPNSGGQNVSYAFNPTHTFTQPGLYVVKLKAWNSD